MISPARVLNGVIDGSLAVIRVEFFLGSRVAVKRCFPELEVKKRKCISFFDDLSKSFVTVLVLFLVTKRNLRNTIVHRILINIHCSCQTDKILDPDKLRPFRYIACFVARLITTHYQ